MVYKYHNNYTQHMDTIGKRIKYFRKKLDLTQDEFAHKYGFSIGQIRHWEGDRHQPDFESLKILCSIFNTTTDTLLGFENEQNDPLLDLLFSDIQRAYNGLDGRQQGRFAKQLSVYVKMLSENKDIL